MYIKREYYLEIIRRYYDSNLIKVISGVRRCGKSVLLSQIKDEILYLGKANEEHIIFVNLEDFKFMSLNNANKLNSYINKLIKDDKKYFLLMKFNILINLKGFSFFKSNKKCFPIYSAIAEDR